MRKARAIFFGVFFLFMGAILPSVADAQTCSSQGGTCQAICDLNATTFAPSTDCTGSTGECCVPRAVTPPAVTCAGVCVPVTGSCPTGTVIGGGSSTCGSTRMCCVTGATGSPTTGPGATGSPTGGSVNFSFENPLVFTDVNELLIAVLTFLQGFIVVIALIFIVVGAVLYITSGGDTGRIETAKKCIRLKWIGSIFRIHAMPMPSLTIR